MFFIEDSVFSGEFEELSLREGQSRSEVATAFLDVCFFAKSVEGIGDCG